MGLEVKGLDRLISRLDELSNVPTQYGVQITREAANQALEVMQEEAYKRTGESAKALAIVDKREYTGSAYYEIGINRSNWKSTRGIYFHNFGFKSRKGTLWMNNAHTRINKEVKKEIRRKLKVAMKL